MRAIPYRTVLEDVLGVAGYPYDEASQGQLDIATNFINRHVRHGWEWGPWPEWTRSEYRAFAGSYYAITAYGVGDVVYYGTTDTYYICTAISTSNLPTDISFWSEYTAYDKMIANEQPYERKLGRVYTVTRDNPYLKFRGSTKGFPHMMSSLGLFVPDCGLKRVWVLFSDRNPRFSAKPHSATQIYQAGDVVYYPGTEDVDLFPDRGQCYVAVVDSAGAETWVIVEFPEVLHAYVVNKAGADMLRYYQQRELAVVFDELGQGQLLDEWDKVNTEGYQKVTGQMIEVGI